MPCKDSRVVSLPEASRVMVVVRPCNSNGASLEAASTRVQYLQECFIEDQLVSHPTGSNT